MIVMLFKCIIYFFITQKVKMLLQLPHSFETNGFQRMINFLNESNRIESIKEIDYNQKEYQDPQKGHFGAFILSQQDAINDEPLTYKKIKEWQRLVTMEQVAHGHHLEPNEMGCIRGPNLPKNVKVGKHIPPHYDHVPTLFSYLLEQINEGLADKDKLRDDAEYCKFLGESFYKFEWIHPFADGNGRLGRIVANYIATSCQRPIIVFESDMIPRNRYYEAHDNSKQMVCFMAKKVQEVIFGLNHQLLFRKKTLGLTSIYESKDGHCQESYEWHSLNPFFQENKQENNKIEEAVNAKVVQQEACNLESELKQESQIKNENN